MLLNNQTTSQHVPNLLCHRPYSARLLMCCCNSSVWEFFFFKHRVFPFPSQGKGRRPRQDSLQQRLWHFFTPPGLFSTSSSSTSPPLFSLPISLPSLHPCAALPIQKNAPIPREQYLLLAEKKVTRSIISKWTFDLTFTEEAENSCQCWGRSRFPPPLYILGWGRGCTWVSGAVEVEVCQPRHCLTRPRRVYI